MSVRNLTDGDGRGERGWGRTGALAALTKAQAADCFYDTSRGRY